MSSDDEKVKWKSPTGPRPVFRTPAGANRYHVAAIPLSIRIMGMLGPKANITKDEMTERVYKFIMADGAENADAQLNTIVRLLMCENVPAKEKIAFLKKINSSNKDVLKTFGMELAIDTAEDVGGMAAEKIADVILNFFNS